MKPLNPNAHLKALARQDAQQKRQEELAALRAEVTELKEKISKFFDELEAFRKAFPTPVRQTATAATVFKIAGRAR